LLVAMGEITSQCSDFHQIMTRVKAEPWTGSPEEEDFVRAVTTIRNRSCEFSNLYGVLRSASYPVGKTFPFVDAYHFLVAQNLFVAKTQQESSAVYPTGSKEAASAGTDKTSPLIGSDNDRQQDAVAAITGAFSDTAPVKAVFSAPQCGSTADRKRPEGVKEAKRKKKRGENADEDLDNKLSAWIEQISRAQSALSAQQYDTSAAFIPEKRKANELKERSIKLDECRTLFGEDAPPAMRAATAYHMRAKWLQNVTRRQDSSPTLLPVIPQPTTPEFVNSGSYAGLDNSRRSKRRSLFPDDGEDEYVANHTERVEIKNTIHRTDSYSCEVYQSRTSSADDRSLPRPLKILTKQKLAANFAIEMEDREDGRFCAAGVENCRVLMSASTPTNFCKNMDCPAKARGVVLNDLCAHSVMERGSGNGESLWLEGEKSCSLSCWQKYCQASFLDQNICYCPRLVVSFCAS
jgi:hypothetical protein